MSASAKQPSRVRTSPHPKESVKRARVATDTHLDCTVIDPNKSSAIEGFGMIGSSGNGFAPKHLTLCVRFNALTNPTFGKLWMRFDSKMMRPINGLEPFTDFSAPLLSMERTFYLCDWKPEYESLRVELAIFKYTHSLAKIEEEVQNAQKALEEARAALDLLIEKKTECAALLEEAKKSVN